MISIIALLITTITIGGIYIKIQSAEIQILQDNLMKKEIDLSNERANNVTLRSSIKDQNEKIEANKNDYDSKIKQYEQWKNQPAEVKYKYITKEVKSNECEDIKKSIDDSIDRLNAYRLHNKN
jgi:uncharacterized membrane protein